MASQAVGTETSAQHGMVRRVRVSALLLLLGVLVWAARSAYVCSTPVVFVSHAHISRARRSAEEERRLEDMCHKCMREGQRCVCVCVPSFMEGLLSGGVPSLAQALCEPAHSHTLPVAALATVGA